MAPLRTSTAGFSLPEALLSISLLGMVIGTIGLVAVSGSHAYETSTMDAVLVQQGKRAMARVVSEMTTTRARSLQTVPVSPLWVSQLEFLKLEDVAADGSLAWRIARVRFRYEEGEVDDGLDNDGDGLVDEGVLELVTDWGGAGERTHVLTRWVREHLEGEDDNGLDDNGNQLRDERGFCVERDGDTLRIRLTLERRDSQGGLRTQSIETSIHARN